MKYRVKHLCEYAVLRSVAAVMGVLPYRMALTLGWGLSVIGFYFLRFRRAEAERRIRLVFGERHDAAAVKRMARDSFRNLMFTAVDIIRSPSLTLDAFEGMAECDFFETLRQQRESGRGAVIAVPHMGSWELAGRAMQLLGMPVFSVAGKQRNPLFDRYLNETRERAGIPITMRGAATLRTIIDRLGNGGFLAVLPDVRMPTEGVRARFLGGEVNVGPGMAMFARHTGVPIYPIIMRRVGWARHVGHIYPAIEPDSTLSKQEDIQRMTQQVLDIVEGAIREDPGQWFWYNKRWVLDPVG
jgi:KDO2-lipid IV(A) lauroyltransferase